MTMNEQIGSLMRAERKRARMTLDEVAKRMGHDSSVMTLEYARSSEEAKREAIEKRG